VVNRLLLVLLVPLGFAQTGAPVPALSALDAIMQEALRRYHVSGGSLAVVKNGLLVFARGYGLADTESGELVQPDSLFRWCSVSKALTAATLMRLVEQGKVDLDAPIFALLDRFAPYNDAWGDSALRAITVRQVLHHTAGWDRSISPYRDPVVGPGTVVVSQATGAAVPPTLDSVIRYMLAQPLDFAPGARFACSNFGYELIGRVVETAGGRPYAAFVRDTILDPFGLPNVQQAGAHLSGRLPGEVKYYDFPGAPLVDSYVSPAREKVLAPYGYLTPELGDSAGAWVGSAVDLAKLMVLIGGDRRPAIVAPGLFPGMLAQSQPPTTVSAGTWYGFGLFVQPYGSGFTWYHGGSNPGSRAFFCRFVNGGGFAYLFNGDAPDAASLSSYTTAAVVDFLASLRSWPANDLFPRYYPPRISPGAVVDAITYRRGPISPGSIAAIFGVDLGGRDSGISVFLRDAAGNEQTLELLHSDPHQLNVRIPETAEAGTATLFVTRQPWPAATATVALEKRGRERTPNL
jgi:N-acyl-D-amino-acid deacylase